MKEEIVHLKIPNESYRKLRKLAENSHRTIHSMLRHLAILAIEDEYRSVKDAKKAE